MVKFQCGKVWNQELNDDVFRHHFQLSLTLRHLFVVFFNGKHEPWAHWGRSGQYFGGNTRDCAPGPPKKMGDGYQSDPTAMAIKNHKDRGTRGSNKSSPSLGMHRKKLRTGQSVEQGLKSYHPRSSSKPHWSHWLLNLHQPCQGDEVNIPSGYD
jgi:hypothetical protein